MDRRFKFSAEGIFEVMPDGTERPVTGTEFRHHQFGISVSELRARAVEQTVAQVISDLASDDEPIDLTQ